VLSSFALCGVPDVSGTLAEVLRVLRPGGTFVFFEHVAAPRRTLRRALQWLRKVLSSGCDPQRETVAALLAAGFSSLEINEVSPSVIVGVAKKGG
jgi:ubiquinone/menaquinone biosynthesis C-methylase UbiE